MHHEIACSRRAFLRGAAASGAALSLPTMFPAWAQSVSTGRPHTLPVATGPNIALTIDRMTMTVDGHLMSAVGINGTVPGPVIRLREGQNVRLSVTNNLSEDSSIHWHGLLVPFAMDGVPGISFPGIAPRSTFVYEIPIVQAGTYWYHSHSGEQEQDGLYGPIIIDPAGADPVAYDREHVIVLSDHSRMSGAAIYRRLKQMGGGYFNMQRLTLSGLLAGRDLSAGERRQWAQMRMDPADIADVTGSTYTFLANGHGPFDNWTGLFTPGERVRLRIINASAQTNFNVRIPDLPMTVVQADGQNVRPVTTDEFQIGVAETYDVIVTPEDRAYTVVGEAIDRSGLARATLAPRNGMAAPVPPLRPRPLTTMRDMGMGDMGGMDMPAHGASGSQSAPRAPRGVDPSAEQNASEALARASGWNAPTDHGARAVPPGAMAGMDMAPAAGAQPAHGSAMAPMDHAQMGHGPTGNTNTGSTSQAGVGAGHGSMSMRDPRNAPGVRMGPGVQTVAPMPTDRTGEPPQGLEGMDHRVLTYRDLVALERNPDRRAPSRSLDVHLTGNMERYMWSFDGQAFSEPAEPLAFRKDERVRVRLINDTMMTHPIHLHGHFFELVTGHGDFAPRKHTVSVMPGGLVTFDMTADAVGDWAFHCHNLYHMMAGMMRVVTVRQDGETTNAPA